MACAFLPVRCELHRERLQALDVLREMLYLSSSKTAEGNALSVAVATLSALLQDSGFRNA